MGMRDAYMHPTHKINGKSKTKEIYNECGSLLANSI